MEALVLAPAVDDVGGSQLGQVQATVEQINRDDRRGREGSGFDDIEANATGAKHHNGLAHTKAGIVFHHTETSGDRAAQKCGGI